MSDTLARLEEYRERGALRSERPLRRATRIELLEELKNFGAQFEKKLTGFKSAEQELVVYKALEGEDALVIMPTGSGKSLTYQFPAYVRREARTLTLVISPLKALIDQHAELPGAVKLTSDTQIEDRPEVWRSISEREKYILLLSPEMLANRHFRQRLATALRRGRLKLGRFVVDEVHCLSDWGHDFRPHYWWVAHHLRALEREARAGVKMGPVPRLLLTATADQHVLADVRRHFPEVADPECLVHAPIGRPEILLSAKKVDSDKERLRVLVRFLHRQASRPLPRGTKRRGIVYNLEAVSKDLDQERPANGREPRLKANEVADYLRKNGFRKVYTYTSKGMSRLERAEAIEAFDMKASTRKGQLTVVVATNAFGMGMDYSRIPFVCHLYPRPNVLEYWQQVGRAGRGFQYPDEWAETLAVHAPGDGEYARRFARAPALDGLLNAFTIPLHGWMYVWPRGGADMSLYGKSGSKTRFHHLLLELQQAGIVSELSERAVSPRQAVRYKVDLDMVRKREVRERLAELRDGRFKRSKRLRKVFRYLLVAGRSHLRRDIVLDQKDYAEDRQGTVLQRLNRWVDLGLLQLDNKFRSSTQIRLLRVGGRLTQPQIRAIERQSKAWGSHKKLMVDRLMKVLAAESPERRRKLVLAYFDEREKEPPVPFTVPKWLLGAEVEAKRTRSGR